MNSRDSRVAYAASSGGEAWLVYDGQCPFCSAYVRYVRVRESVGILHLLDARLPHPVVEEARGLGLDLDQGMVLKLGNRFFHGADCINVLALMSTRSGPFNRLNGVIFRSPTASKLLYPLLRVGRNLALRLLGRDTLASSSSPVGPSSRG